MYEPFFGMERRPFSATPDPGCFFSSSELQTAIEELTLCVERGQGIGILTAAAGIGKTLLCQHLAASLRQRDESKPQFECVYLANSNFPTRRSLLQAILFEMGDEYSRRDEPELRIDLRSRLLSLRPQREALVLIVDEAHIFSDDLLEELRTLSDLADNGSSLVRIVLSGQHELEERLTDRAFDALNQRISKQVYAEPFTISESVDYIQHRLAWSGCDIESVFSEEAIGVITRASGGVPRCLNQLCDHSLLLAFASDQKPVSESTVREALEDLKQLPLHWNDVSDGTEVVGYVDGEDEEDGAAEEFDAQPTDESIDPKIEAALAKLASGSVTESPSADAADGFAADNGDDGDVEFDGVESLSGVSSENSNTAPVSPLGGGFEFDFSSTAEDTPDADQVIDSVSSEGSQDSPEFSELESSNDGPSTSANADWAESGQADFDDADVTLVQVLPSTTQETMLETRPPSDGHADGSEDEGISFKITSDGFELNDFGPPEELDSQAAVSSADDGRSDSDEAAEESASNEEQADSGMIEFSFSDAQSSDESESTDSCETEELADESTQTETVESADVEQFEPENSEEGTDERTVSAAEITLALFGQDSVLPEHKCDTVLSVTDETSEADESKFDGAQDEGSPDAAEIEPVAEDARDIAQPAAAFGPTPEEAVSGETDADVENSHDEEPAVMSQVVNSKIGYEEELVYDPYAALQEPDGAGIVWNVVSAPKQANIQDAVDSTDQDDVSIETPQIAAVESGESSKTIDSAKHREEQSLEPETTVETVESTDQSGEPSREDSEVSSEVEAVAEHEPAAELAEESESAFQQLEEGNATENEVEDAAPVELIDSEVEERCELEVRPDITDADLATNLAEDQAEEICQQDGDSVETTTDAAQGESDEATANEHDIVQPVEERPLQPDRLVDAVLPLLAELDEDLDSVSKPAVAGRSVLDIEAELIQTIEHDSDELEDQIGATMLDICLDTQSALQDSAAAIRNAEAEGLENVIDAEDAADELSSESFDIVQPEPPHADEESEYKLDLRFEELSNKQQDTAPSTEPSANEGATEKPFGRLFSDLRRRKR